MDEEVIWLLVFGTFVTIIFIVGVYYTITEFRSLNEPEQRKEHDESQEAKIDQKNKGKR